MNKNCIWRVYCRGRHCIASGQPRIVFFSFWMYNVSPHWNTTTVRSSRTPLFYTDCDQCKRGHCKQTRSCRSTSKYFALSFQRPATISDVTQTSSDANSSICLAQIVHTMLSLWSLTQTGYCAVRVIKKGNAVALCELGQVGKEVNTCLCQQNDVIW